MSKAKKSSIKRRNQYLRSLEKGDEIQIFPLGGKQIVNRQFQRLVWRNRIPFFKDTNGTTYRDTDIVIPKDFNFSNTNSNQLW